MTDHRKPTSFALPAIGAFVLVVLGVYVGVYYWKVDRIAMLGFETVDPIYVRGDREANRRWCKFFSPVHQFDRHLRPHYWALPPDIWKDSN